MELTRWDSLLEWLKRQQRWYYGTEYRDLELAEGWLRRPEDAVYQESLVPLTLPRPLRTILVFKPDEIGDAVCSLPALAELRREFPDATLSLICLRETQPIYERSGLVDRIATVEMGVRWRRFRRLKLDAALRELGDETYDATIFLKTYPPLFGEFLKIPARFRIHARDPRLKSDSLYQPRVSLWGRRRVHQSLQLLEIVSAATGKSYAYADVQFPPLRWTEEDRKAPSIVFTGEVPSRYLVVHPFAKFETRRYPMDYWPAVLDGLRADPGLPIVAIGGPADGTLDGSPHVIQAQGKLTLGQTAFLISGAAGFVGNLSGPAHLAGALGVPTATLMSGHSAPAEWAPTGRSLVLRADVPCAPCHLWSCPQYGLACLKELTPEKVLPAVRRFFLSHA